MYATSHKYEKNLILANRMQLKVPGSSRPSHPSRTSSGLHIFVEKAYYENWRFSTKETFKKERKCHLQKVLNSL